jgi:hypothetical protein
MVAPCDPAAEEPTTMGLEDIAQALPRALSVALRRPGRR